MTNPKKKELHIHCKLAWLQSRPPCILMKQTKLSVGGTNT